MKIHHTLIDGVSAMRMILRALSGSPRARDTPAFWTVCSSGRRSPISGASTGLRFHGGGNVRDKRIRSSWR